MACYVLFVYTKLQEDTVMGTEQNQDEYGMNTRIETQQNGEETTVFISGDLAGRGVDELESLCRKTGGSISIDLDSLRLMGTDGVELLSELLAQGVRLLRVSPYHKLLLGLADE